MSTETLVIIILVVLLLGGGGFYWRGRRWSDRSACLGRLNQTFGIFAPSISHSSLTSPRRVALSLVHPFIQKKCHRSRQNPVFAWLIVPGCMAWND